MEFHIGSQASSTPPKIAISQVFVISWGNILKDKAQDIFLFSFPGRVPVILHWVSEGFYVPVLLLKKYLASKIEKKCSTWFFFTIL